MKLFALLLLLTIVLAEQQGVRVQFEAWMRMHHKSYANGGEMDHAFENFRASLNDIERAKQDNPLAEFSLNEFSDLSNDEFQALYLNSPSIHSIKKSVSSASASASTRKAPQHFLLSQQKKNGPLKFDWREEGAITPVMMQGNTCGSCYSFACAENLEALWYIHGRTSKVFQLSKQQIVDCAGGGCDGLDCREAFKYVSNVGGLMSEADYNYTSGQTGRPGTCHPNPSKFVVTGVSGYAVPIPDCLETPEKCDDQDEKTLSELLPQLGPFAVPVAATYLKGYKGGILTNCTSDPYQLNHWVQLVAFDFNPGQQYWVFKNSWSTSWGENGYFRTLFGKNRCGMADLPLYGTFN
eukprot:TRINITY_DN7739_c0_g1_i1.p1 TRINITY_DN7739_c0_g1~~TRINITY_DN7739_c0_g1_i1.p1  ORF type:complete len:352 (-),score=70.36 TRINITY_DN7739_c0_g1_i1:121-1176(-)